jgi:hypothetical protein
MENQVSTRLKDAASLIGYSENQLIVESVVGILDVAEDHSNPLPRVVVLIRSARQQRAAPVHFGEKTSSQQGVRRWWGA